MTTMEKAWIRADVVDKITAGFLAALADYGKVSNAQARYGARRIRPLARNVPKSLVMCLETMNEAGIDNPEDHLGRLIFCAATGYGTRARDTPSLRAKGLHLTLHNAVEQYIGKLYIRVNKRNWASLSPYGSNNLRGRC